MLLLFAALDPAQSALEVAHEYKGHKIVCAQRKIYRAQHNGTLKASDCIQRWFVKGRGLPIFCAVVGVSLLQQTARVKGMQNSAAVRDCTCISTC